MLQALVVQLRIIHWLISIARLGCLAAISIVSLVHLVDPSSSACYLDGKDGFDCFHMCECIIIALGAVFVTRIVVTMISMYAKSYGQPGDHSLILACADVCLAIMWFVLAGMWFARATPAVTNPEAPPAFAEHYSKVASHRATVLHSIEALGALTALSAALHTLDSIIAICSVPARHPDSAKPIRSPRSSDPGSDIPCASSQV